ncbi:MAG: DNA-binding NtrC family response regulator/tetratricopeptide (TPR) repeat protein, partial [Myxococcota bacterium]
YRPFSQIANALAAGSDPADLETIRPLLAGALGAVQGKSDVHALLEQVRVRDGRLNHMESVRRALCEVAARRRLVLVIADVQSADDDTLAMIDYLIDDAAPAGGIIGGRGVARPELVLTVDDDTSAGRIRLDALRESSSVASVAVGRMTSSDVGAVLSEQAMTDKLLKVSQGLPQRLRALILALPDDLQSLLDSRLAGLPSEARAILQAACVYGSPLTPRALASVSDASRLAIQRLRGTYLEDVAVGGDVCVQVVDAWAGSPLLIPTGDDAIRLHSRSAEHLIACAEVSGDESLSERIARHWLAAGQADLAAPYALQSAVWLRQSSAMERAAELLELAIAAQPAQTDALQLALVELDVAMGRFDTALGRCSQLTGGQDMPLPLREARIHSLNGNLDAALQALEGLANAPLPNALREVADAQLADVLLRRGALERSEAVCTQRLNAGVSDTLVALNMQHTLAKIAFWRSEHAEAEQRYQRVVAGLDQREDDAAGRRLRALVQHNLGLVSLRNGRYQEAIDRIQDALGSLEALGEHFEAAVCGHNLGLANEYCQRYGMAIALFERGIEVLERFGNRVNLTGALNSLGDLYLTLGEHWRARKLLEYSHSLASDNGLDYFVAFNQTRLARLALAEGRLEDGVAPAAAAVAAFTASGHGEELAEAHLVRAELAHAQNDIETAQASLAVCDEGGSREVIARSQIIAARLLRPSNPTKAHSVAVAASEVLRGLGQRDGVALALIEAAIAALAGGQAKEHERLLKSAETVIAELRERVPATHREAFDVTGASRALSVARHVESESVVAPVAQIPRRGPRTRSGFRGMVGESTAMLRVFDMIERLADCDAPILITGESGTGKECVAEAICAESTRADKPFVRVNAAAFADTLLESELFGHEKGAFTGAVQRKLGAFEQADGGTLFLDEIGDISAKTQVSLLRVLQEREFRRVGGRKPIKVDVRIVCATNRNLEEMVQNGTFRLDLYYRVKGLTIELPALRERGDDISLLADRILDGLARKHGTRLAAAPDAQALLTRYRWPGNVRELENVLRSVYFFAHNGRITAEDLQTYTLLREARPQDMGGNVRAVASLATADDVPLTEGFDLNDAKRDLEIACIRKALRQTDGNITKAAALLGMKRPRLSQKIKEYRLK